MSLTVVIAPMFSGKTTYLLSQASIAQDLGFSPVFITHSLETRDKDIFTHSCLLKPDNDSIKIIKTNSIKSIYEDILKYSHIFIDEYQFFESEDNTFIELLAEVADVYVAGLKADSNQKKFGHIIDLIPIADNVISLKSSCIICAKSGKRVDAAHTVRTKNNKESNLIVIGASKEYIPVCRNHL